MTERRTGADALPGWRETPAKQAVLDFVHAVGATEFRNGHAYTRDPVLGSGTDQILAAAAENKWTVIDMATDWSAVYPPPP